MEYRIEYDSLGAVKVPKERLYGAQTERSRCHFPADHARELMPKAVISALAVLKAACANVNQMLLPQRMTEEKALLITQVCGEIENGMWDAEFPLSVFQTGSGTQTNMNVNEVIANRGNGLYGKKLLHPNDDCNMSQSSNDAFPSAMHISAVLETEQVLLPTVRALCATMRRLEDENRDCIKCGRTHLQDAVPMRFSQEISGWRSMLETDAVLIHDMMHVFYPLAIGGTAVGTGLNAPNGFGDLVAKTVAEKTGQPFCRADNAFSALSGRSAFTAAHGVIKTLACDLMKIANDIRLLASGPRCGIGEITLPANEPGSSIMPGKVNPTQCEALTMAAVQVMGNDTAITVAVSQGNFQLNVYMPLLIDNYLRSVRLLASTVHSFDTYCAAGIRANSARMAELTERSLMLVTALTPKIGYERAAAVAKEAQTNGITLREACEKLQVMTVEEYDSIVHPEKMTGEGE